MKITIHLHDVWYHYSMEFELEGGQFVSSGNVEITLPDYMVMLPQEQLDAIETGEQLIIAAGRATVDADDIVVMTNKGVFKVLSSITKNLPHGIVSPDSFGWTLSISTPTNTHEYPTYWVLENAAEMGSSAI